MDYYLKQAMLIKTIAKRSNPEILPQNPVSSNAKKSNPEIKTQNPVSSNALSFGNNNDTDYTEQAKQKLSSFITDPAKLDQITTALYTDNDKYLKELVLNWPEYEAKLQTLKGSVVSVKRVVDVLEDKLQEALGKKAIKPDKSVVAERKEELEERNMMGDEDILANNVRSQVREVEREKIKEIQNKCEALVDDLRLAIKKKYNTFKKLIEFLEKYGMINEEEKTILSTQSKTPEQKAIKESLRNKKFDLIMNKLSNVNGRNVFYYLIIPKENDTISLAVRDSLQEILSPADFSNIMAQVQYYQEEINKIYPRTESKQIYPAAENVSTFSSSYPADKYSEFAPKENPLIHKLRSPPSTPNTSRVDGATEHKEGTGMMKVVNGYGLKNNEKVVNNKYYVNTDLLKNHGILEIRYVKNRHMAHVKPPMLSEKCKGCVVDMINGGKINSDHFVSLSHFEKDLLRKVDKLFNTNQNLHDDDDDNFNKNFELLKGSYLAGNDNQSVKNQLRQYITHAYEIGKISRWVRDRMLMELKLI